MLIPHSRNSGKIKNIHHYSMGNKMLFIQFNIQEVLYVRKGRASFHVSALQLENYLNISHFFFDDPGKLIQESVIAPSNCPHILPNMNEKFHC